MHGTVLFQHQESIQPGLYEKDNYYGIFFRAFEMIASEAEKLGIPLIGIGVGFPALVNSDEGLIIQSVPLMIHQAYAFAQEVSKVIDVPVIIENDARCCCYGEQLLSESHNIRNMLFLLTEYRVLQPTEDSKKNLSVGLGLVVNGRILKGPECSAGEFRSILWDEGNNGQFFSGEDRLESIDNDVMQSVFFELAQHVAFLVNTLNLEQVYIGGIDKQYADKLMALIQERISYQWPYRIQRKYTISLASLETLSVAYGAAAMFLEQMFALPSLSSRSGTGRSVLKTFADLKRG
jgi:predicted NBD/HSP70 family sugar kinase